MSSDKATAVLALVQATRALKMACSAFEKLGDAESAALTLEMAEDANELVVALTAPNKAARAVVS